MIFLPVGFIAAGLLLGALLLIAVQKENAAFLALLERTSVKTLAFWLLGTNLVGFIAIIVMAFIVPRPKVIYFNLLCVWVALTVLTVSGGLYFLLSDGKTTLQVGTPNDIAVVVLIFVLASLAAAWRIEILSKNGA